MRRLVGRAIAADVRQAEIIGEDVDDVGPDRGPRFIGGVQRDWREQQGGEEREGMQSGSRMSVVRPGGSVSVPTSRLVQARLRYFDVPSSSR
jgi:hypothetical protein